jgi:hypothetical protein
MIEVIKNILPKEINKKIILFLLKSRNWGIAKDKGGEVELLNELIGTSGKDYGFSLQTLDVKDGIYIEGPLNLYAEIIYEIIKKHTKYKFLKPMRFYWNYYNNFSQTLPHKDRDENFYLSFVYNLHDNDGGTKINDEFFKSNSGEAILFPSNCMHVGISSSNTKGRFNLNCIVELERSI